MTRETQHKGGRGGGSVIQTRTLILVAFLLVACLAVVPSAAFAQTELASPTRENSGAGSPASGEVSKPADKPDSEPSQSPEEPDRPFGSAWFGGDPGKPIFGPSPAEPGKTPPEWPNISEPGPDMGDFPNSANTLPKGRAYLEFSPVTIFNSDRQNPAGYAAPYLLRYGLTDDVEFRVFGNGLTYVGNPSPTTGFSPLNLDLKVHLWDDRKEWLIPAVSLEGYVLTTWGSSQFNGGWQPSLNLNFDLPITSKLDLEWTLAYGGIQKAINTTTGEVFTPRYNFPVPGVHQSLDFTENEFSVQWAVEYELTETLEVFVHGFYNGAPQLSLGSGEMVGAGAFWKLSSRTKVFGSLNTGLTPNMPSIAGQLGVAIAL